VNNDYGVIRTDQGHPRVSFERVLNAAIDSVWAMLTTEDGLEKWLAPASVELRIGGAMDIDFGEEESVGGEIIDLEPGRVLEYHWRFSGEPDSIIRFELDVVDDEQTRLRLDHRLLPEDQAVGYGAGWHAHLDQLGLVVATDDRIDWMERFNELLPEYQKAAS
jgi:uncharacterized protein YndB with AHSA1/START domain